AGPSPRDPHGRKARAYSFAALVRIAGGAGDHEEVLRLLAEEAGVEAPDRCALGIALEEDLTAVARDAGGAVVGRYLPRRPAVEIDPAALVPGDIAGALAGCELVDVLARPPVHGMPGLLGPEVAWRYLGHRRSRAGRGAGPRRRVVIADPIPPAELHLPRLAGWRGEPGDVELRGPAATPSAVAAALSGASEIEIHAHGLVHPGMEDAAFLALSPDADGRFALTASRVRRLDLAGAPLVLLGACRATRSRSNLHARWSLPAAFVEAGASAVIASSEPIPDAQAADFFAAVRRRISEGQAAAAAVRDERMDRRDRPGGAWVDRVLVFE
ncbi:MAG TPA: CHAT domain-containing protein, partial [Kofleriaceae bacterium]|nr:CHAT domain-containing protein [Kofleriaceae bacterium]